MSRAELAQISGDLAQALLDYSDREGGLDEPMLEGAWSIALASDGPLERALLGELLNDADSMKEPLRSRILRDIPALPDNLQRQQGGRLLGFLEDDPAGGVAILSTFDDSIIQRAVTGLGVALEEATGPLLATQGEGEPEEVFNERQARGRASYVAVGDVVGQLANGGLPAQAEAIATEVLAADTPEARNAIQGQLVALTPITTEPLTRAVLRAAARRVPRLKAQWLAPLAPDLTRSVDDGGQVFRVVEDVWRNIANGRATEEAVGAIAQHLARLQVGRPWARTLALREIIEDPAGLSYDAYEAKLRSIQPLLDLDLIANEDLAAARMAVAVGELRRAQPPGSDFDEPASFVLRTFRDLLSSGSEEEISEAWMAFLSAGWLPSVDECRLRILFAAIALRRKIDLDDLPSAEHVGEYVREHGSEVAADVAQWLSEDPGNAAIWQIVRVFDGTPPATVLNAVSSVAERRDPASRLELAQPALAGRPNERLLEALRFPQVDQRAAAEILLARFAQATNNRGREQVLLLWRALRPTEDEARRQLISNVMVPMATLNREALELVLREVDLARDPPRGTKGALRSALREGGNAFDRGKPVRRRLEQLGWSRRAGGIRRRDVDVDQPGDA